MDRREQEVAQRELGQAKEEILRPSEWLRLALSSIGDGVIATDGAGRVTFMNRVAEAFTGWRQDEALGRPLSDVFRIVNEHSREPVENPALRALAQGTVVGLANHTLLIARDGSECPIDDSAAPLLDDKGAPLGAVLVFRDVTERKRAEETRHRLAAIVESSQDAIVSKTLDGVIQSWNVGAQRLFGYAADEVIGRSITLLIPDEFQAEERAILARLARGERVEHFDTVRVTKDGRRIDISLTVSPVRDSTGRVIGASKVARDITARKRAEEALRDSEGRHRVLAELAEATQPLTAPAAIMSAAARLLAEHLSVDRCAYAEVEDEATFVITGDHPRNVPSIVGRWPVAAFGAGCVVAMQANEPFVVVDTDTDPRITAADLPAYRATTIRAVICVPLHKRGKFTAAMAVHSTVPRRWTSGEVQLVTTVVGRCWEALERAAAERALSDSRARLDYAVRVSGIGFWYCDLPFDVLLWDARVKEHFWLPPDATVTIATFYDRLHPDDRQRTRLAIDRSIGDRSSYDIHYRTVDPLSGAIKWIRALGGTAYGPDGRPLRFDGVTLDVTEQRRAELEARESSERFRMVARATNDAVWDWDMRTNQVWWNDGMTTIFGHRPADIGPAADWWSAHIHPDDRNRVVRSIHAVVDHGGSHWAEEYRFLKSDGTYAHVSDRGYAVHSEEGTTLRMVGGMQDVTARKEAEAELTRFTEASERRKRLYETALSNTPDLVYVFDLDHRFTYANEALLRMWGKSWDEAIGKNWLELGYEGWHASMHDLEIEQVRATKKPLRGEVPFNGTNGRRIYDYIFVPVLGADGEVEAVAGTTRDVTDRQAMEQELREADQKKDDFIALLAHELRNPLAPIRNGLQVLRLAGGSAPELEQARAMMDRQLAHMVRLIDDLLDVSRISRNKMELRRARVTLAEVVSSAVETARPLIDEAGHDLTVLLPAFPLYLDADLTRLAQVFSNLLTNSAKYTPAGGKIWLSVERRRDHVEVSVRDNGIGIPPAALPNIFDMFSQVDRSIERHTGGLGIGLALVKGLVEMHGGTVSATSAGDGSGSTFVLTLPLAGQAAAATPAASEPPAPGSKRRVLVVDDNRDGADSLALMLRLLGNEVRTANDGVEAVEAAGHFRPEVILMDVGMPRLNGLDATRRIREQAWGKIPTIIALTGWGQEGDRERSRAAGCDGHLVKPVHLPDLEKLLRREP